MVDTMGEHGKIEYRNAPVFQWDSPIDAKPSNLTRSEPCQGCSTTPIRSNESNGEFKKCNSKRLILSGILCF